MDNFQLINFYTDGVDIFRKEDYYYISIFCDYKAPPKIKKIIPKTLIKQRTYEDGIFYFMPNALYSMYNEHKLDKYIGGFYIKQDIITIEEFLENWMVCNL